MFSLPVVLHHIIFGCSSYLNYILNLSTPLHLLYVPPPPPTTTTTTTGTQKTQVSHTYKHRTDLLRSRVKHIKSGEVCESFDPGREKSLKSKLTIKQAKLLHWQELGHYNFFFFFFFFAIVLHTAHTHYDSNPLRVGHRSLEFYS